MALTDIKVRSAKPQEKEYTLADGDGMFLLIHSNGSKYWRFRFRFGGKQHLMAFGVYPETSLADARQKREEARKLVAAGIDPREHKRAVKEEQTKEAITFESVAREWHAANKKWTEEHSRRVLKSLEDNLFPAIGKRSIDSFSTRDLLVPIKVVEATGRLEVASRLQQRTNAIMRYAVQSGLIDYQCRVSSFNHIRSSLESLRNSWLRIQKKFGNPFWFSSTRYDARYLTDYQWVMSYFDKNKMINGNVDFWFEKNMNLKIYSIFDQ